MPIVTEDEITSFLKMQRYGHLGIQVSRQFMHLLGINGVNDIYDKFQNLEGLDFINAVLEHLKIKVDISKNDLKRIPKEGPFILIANHPLGAIDGLIMLKILLTYHPKSMIMANFLLKKIKPISDHICAVNPFENRKDVFCSNNGLRQALNQLQSGQPLGIFPAGEVSVRANKFIGPIHDKPWDLKSIKFIKKANVPVIPVYFHARNSHIFYWMADIHTILQTARLPFEVIKSKNKLISVRVGNAISIADQNGIKSIEKYGEILRSKVYMLKHAFNKFKIKPFVQYFPKRRISEVLPYQSITELQNNITALEKADALLFEQGDYQIFFTKINNFPAIKTELGRLRELTFRAVGEGTNSTLDLDEYDTYYHHLILWNKNEKEIVGAYRLGLGEDIYQVRGLKGFYISELFHLTGSMHDILKYSIEMGRAFIVNAYQQKPLPLFILWKGIMAVTDKFPQYKFLIGAASISNNYCQYSKSLIIEFLRLHYLDYLTAIDVAPKLSFKSILKSNDKQMLKDSNLKILDKLIDELEPEGLKVPILIKKYILHNAKILGFNVDIKFNDAIDVLTYIRIEDIDKGKFICH